RFLHRNARAATPPPLPLIRQIRTRTLQLWDCLQREFHWRSDTTGYVLKLVVTLGLSTALYRELHWRNGYWAPMTALLVLKPKWANTLSRGVARTAGTMVGAGFCAALAYLTPAFHHTTYFVLIALTAYACFALQAVNYALFSLFLTMYTVFLFAFGGFSERSAADIRLLNTALGGLLALLIDFIAKQLGPRLRPVSSQRTESTALPLRS
ncbi:MAG TPA: FUSC family protein, partial [Acidobacteriaceae bacterium]|nr:FUSC family protein [Acidobacteriaceae bacterium]